MSGLAFAALSACGKKEKDDEDAETTAQTGTVGNTGAGVTPATGSTVTMTGTIALEGLALAPVNWKIMALRYIDGVVAGEKRFPVAADGSFTVSFGNDAENIARLKAIAAGNTLSDADADFLAEYFGVTKDKVIAFWNESAAEVKSHLNETAAAAELNGSQSLLIAYQESGDPVAEAKSMKFIGFPASTGKNAAALPVGKLRGNVNMGTVTLTASQNAQAGLRADEVIIASAGEMDVIVSTSDLVKTAVNRHMNATLGWELEPFFMFTSSAGYDSVKGSFGALTAYPYGGMGFYLSTRNGTTFTWEDVCAVSESARKELSLTPPATIKLRSQSPNSPLVDGTALTNKGGSGDATHTTQEGKPVCHAGTQSNSTGGFYARKDGENDLMINFGTGGTIVGIAAADGTYSLPTGIWPLKYDGTTIGNFDLASSIPVEGGRPRGPALSYKVNVDANNVVTNVNMKVMMWDGTQYTQMPSDAVPLLKALMKDVSFASERTGTGEPSIRDNCAWVAGGTADLLCTPSKTYTWDGLRNVMGSYRAFGMTIHFASFQ